MAEEAHDVMQVCLNGHRITSSANQFPQYREAFCSSCGAATVTKCSDCSTPIRGYPYGSMSIHEIDVPSYCRQCGRPYAWRVAAIENVEEVIRELGLDPADLEDALATLPHTIAETPKTKSAALRLQRLLSKAGKPAYDVVIGVVTDILSETAKKTMGIGSPSS